MPAVPSLDPDRQLAKQELAADLRARVEARRAELGLTNVMPAPPDDLNDGLPDDDPDFAAESAGAGDPEAPARPARHPTGPDVPMPGQAPPDAPFVEITPTQIRWLPSGQLRVVINMRASDSATCRRFQAVLDRETASFRGRLQAAADAVHDSPDYAQLQKLKAARADAQAKEREATVKASCLEDEAALHLAEGQVPNTTLTEDLERARRDASHFASWEAKLDKSIADLVGRLEQELRRRLEEVFELERLAALSARDQAARVLLSAPGVAEALATIHRCREVTGSGAAEHVTRPFRHLK